MKITYTITTKYCPHCKAKLATHNDGWLIIFAPFVLIYFLSYLIYNFIQEKIINISIPKVGEPYFNCPYCGGKILSGKTAYEDLSDNEKVIYQHRSLFYTASFCGAIMPYTFLCGFFVCASDEVAKTIGIIFFCLTALFFLIILYTTVWWRTTGKYASPDAPPAFEKQTNEKPIKKDFFSSDYKMTYIPKQQQKSDLDNANPDNDQNAS